MKMQDLLVDPADLEPYTPPRHVRTVNHRLWPQTDEPAQIEVIHGSLEADGVAQAHFHTRSDQILYVLSGVMRAEGVEDSVDMEKGQFLFIPKGMEHRVRVVSEEGANCLVIYLPRLAADDIHPAKAMDPETAD